MYSDYQTATIDMFLIFATMILVRDPTFINGQKDFATIHCDNKTEYHLQGTGIESSLTLTLAPLQTTTNNAPEACPIRILAPETHLIYIRFGDTQTSNEMNTTNKSDNLSCTLSAYVPEKHLQSVWTGDACNMDTNIPYGLLPNIIMLLWRPPEAKQHMRHKKLLITALGKKEFCRSKNQHTCIHVGWTPLVCVAEELLCDGVVHCPPGAIIGDENQQFCRDRKVLSATNWEKIATEFLKKFSVKTKGGTLLPGIYGLENTTADPRGNHHIEPSSPDSFDNISVAFGHYGPWGYLMLVMLLFGTVLMFCGLWECCCRRPKSTNTTPPDDTPTSVVVGTTPTQETPPRYEELEQPPSYGQLFPDFKNYQYTGSSSATPQLVR